MRSPRGRLNAHLSVMVLTLALVAAACSGDQIALVDPTDAAVRFDVGEIRVLRHPDDPAEQSWRVLLPAAPIIAIETDLFRERDSRTAADEIAADLRRLMKGVGAGRTVLVEIDCRSCEEGEPVEGAADLLVWDLRVGPDDDLVLHGDAAVAGARSAVGVGDEVIVVLEADEDQAPSITELDATVLVPVGRSEPRGPDSLLVAVFVAARPGQTTISYRLSDGSLVEFPITVR